VKINWLPRRKAAVTSTVDTASQEQRHGESLLCRVTISLLTFSAFDDCLALLTDICPLVVAKSESLKVKFTIVVRNNNPHLDSSRFDTFWADINSIYTEINFMLFNDGFNVGFGNGHNLNFDAAPCDYLLILNDDISFSDVDWDRHRTGDT
jgi:GT2 family glycosyltransferase